MFKQLRFVLIAVAMLIPGFVAAAEPPIPLLAQWEQQMVQYGAKHCATIQNPSTSGAVKEDSVYYDGERVYQQIADYTGDSKWLGCAQTAESIYRDGYLAPNNYNAAGWMVFPHGLWKDYLRTQDGASRNAVIQMSERAAYADDRPLGLLSDPALSREVAYNLQSKILAHEFGLSNEAGIYRLAQESFNHMDAWFVSKTATYIRPFMVALTSEGLIMYYNLTKDPRVLPTLQMAWDYLWNCCWVSSMNSFMYTDRVMPHGGMNPAPDLNMLIAPVLGWLYNMTGDTKWRDRGDLTWTGGVQYAYLDQGKQFDQSYRYSFDYIKYRNKTGSPFVVLGSTVEAPPPPPSSSGGGVISLQPSSPPSSGDTGGSSGSSSGSTGSTGSTGSSSTGTGSTGTPAAPQMSADQATAAAQTWIGQHPKPEGGVFRAFGWANEAYNALTSQGFTPDQAKQALRPLLAEQGISF